MTDCKQINNSSVTTHKKPILKNRLLFQITVAVFLLIPLFMHSCKGKSKSINELRVISYNVYECTGWPGEYVDQELDMPTLFADELTKYEPDIINFSESPAEPIVKKIAELLDMNYVWFPSAGNWPGAILTRYEILDFANVPVDGNRPKNLFTRHWGKATVKLPNNKQVIVHSVHIFPPDHPKSEVVMQEEVSLIIKSMQKDLADNKSVIVLGDLNHTPDMPEYDQWINAGLTDTFKKAGKGKGLTFTSGEPYKRIDYVLASGPIASQVKLSKELTEGAFRPDPDDPGSFALSDHLPQMAVFGLSSQP